MFFEKENALYQFKQVRHKLKRTFFLLNRIFKVIGVQNQLPISFGTALVRNKIFIIKNSPNKHEFLTFNISIHVKSKLKVIRK